MDGNGRWAEERGLPRLEGHRVGADSVRDITRACRQRGIKALTLYAFSSQNWARPADEVRGLMDLLEDYLHKERSEILDNQIRLNAIGDLHLLPSRVTDPLSALRADSAHHQEMVLTLALSYGGRESLVRAARRIAEAARTGQLAPDAIDEAALTAALPTHDLPPVDLLIRTSGEQRISNFLLWELAYAELMFVDTPWPEFRRAHLQACLDGFGQRERRFGQTSAQLRSDVGGAQ